MNTPSNKIFTLPKPALVLAPMEQVTDAAYRRIIAKYGKPHLMYTEFTSAEGLCSEGKERLLPDLWYDNSERPVFAQIFGRRPDKMEQAAELCAVLGFDGIDINMGCPEKNVCKSGSGAAMIENPELAKECIRAVQRGAGGLPVSVKTRIGYSRFSRKVMETWVAHLLETEPLNVTLHLRTKKDMSKVPARWSEATLAVKVRDKLGSKSLIFGNGDVKNIQHAEDLVAQTGVDGVMLARAIYGNPWLFNRDVDRENLTVSQRLHVMLEHAFLFERIFNGIHRFVIMRKHFSEYVSGMHNATELRSQLVHTDTAQEALEIVRPYLDEPFHIESALPPVESNTIRAAG